MLLSVILICCGIYATNFNMKTMTLWPGEDPLVFKGGPEGIEVRFLGLNLDKQARGVVDIFSGIGPFVEIKSQTIKEYLQNMLNIN
jgi:hypothetical protein